MGFISKIRRRMVQENRIYIMPSGAGVVYFIGLIILVLTAATYNNNLIFILTFFLASLFFVVMLQTHFNLRGVRLDFMSVDDAFEGERLTMLFRLHQRRRSHKYSLILRSPSRNWATLESPREDLTPRDSAKSIRMTVKAWKRGVHPVPTIILETYYPLGLFRAWKVFRPEGEMIVYPRAKGVGVLEPQAFEYGEEELGLRASPEGDFGELKDYRPGESYHQIAWKHYARTGHLFSKIHWGEEHKFYHIPWTPPAGQVTENYLQQMSQWVSQAVEENATFEMELPTSKILAGVGLDQGKACWRALAAIKGAA